MCCRSHLMNERNVSSAAAAAAEQRRDVTVISTLCLLSLSPPVQELHDHHRVLRKKPIWRGRGCLRRLQDSVLIRLLQPGGPCLTCSTATTLPPHPICPCAPGGPNGIALLRPTLRTDSPLPCVSNAVVAQLHLWQVSRAGAHACVCSLFLFFLFFNPFNHGKCSAGLSE